jgi:tetratricopeptide (TPR) repeat protein
MRRLLGQLLDSHRSPVVLGYSGWEGDVIMSALSEHLRRRRKAGLPNKIYWFCHRRDSLEALPAWLRSDRNLAFVLPEEPRLSGDSGNALARDLEEPEATLPAHRVIGALIHAFGVAPPLLASDPLGFLADQLRLALDLACSEAEPALYNLERVLQRVEHGRSLEAEHWTLTERRLQDFWDAVQRGDDEASVVAGENLIALRLDGAERGKIVDQLDIVRRGLSSHRSTLGLRACDVSLALTPRGVERAPYEGWALRKALALVGRGYRLGQLDRTEEALASYAEVFSSFGDAPAGELREQVIWALYNHSVRLGQLDRAERVLALHAAELENFESSPVSVLREQIIWAIYSHGARLCQIGRLQEAVASCAEVLERSADASVPALREVAGRALLLRGEALGKLDRPEEALISFAEVAERFAGDSTLPLREVVSQALVNQGVTLGLLGREEEALAIFAKVLSRFDDDQAPELRSSVARALANRGVVLLNLDRHEEAAMSFAMVLRRFGDESAPEILRTVEMARRALGSGVPSDGH